MPSSRRSRLLVFAAALVLADALFLIWRSDRDSVYVNVTHVGLDSFAVLGPPSRDPATWLNKRWKPPEAEAQMIVEDMTLKKRLLTVITFPPHATFGRFLASVRQLKGQKKCNALFLESSSPSTTADSNVPPAGDVPALVLCGRSIGDAGFYGTLPPDGPLRL